MNNKWTEEQLAAIETGGCNLLVSAAAGAGKTAVLVERILRLICDPHNPLDIDRLLVVTFTEAAAAEMRERIRAALEKEIVAARRFTLMKQLSLLNGASISTLHAFCLEVIRRYFYLLDLDPIFRVAAEQEAGLLRQEAVEKVLEEAFSRGETDFLDFVQSYGGKTSDEALPALILQLYDFAWSNPWPEAWLQKAYLLYQNCHETGAEVWLSPLKEKLNLMLAEASTCLEHALVLCRQPRAPIVYEDVLQQEWEQVQNLKALLAESWELLREAWLGIHFQRLPQAKDVDRDLKDRVQKLREKAKKILLEAKQIYFFRSLTEFVEEIKQLAPTVKVAIRLVRQFAAQYKEAKKKAGVLDFNDLEHYCLEILLGKNSASGQPEPSPAALELQARFAQVLVDEYQDINPVQDAILQLVSRQGENKGNLFMVGDVKQSIYRFRMGDPGLFLEKYKTYTDAKKNPPGKVIRLSRNFRCRQNIVAAVNYLFAQLMTAEAMEIEYDQDAALVFGAQYPPSETVSTMETEPVEIILVEKKPDAESEQEDLTVVEREAIIVAQKIQELKQKKLHVFDPQVGYRPLAYRDIVILMRSTANRADKVAEILARYQIPAYADLESGYFAATEVAVMLSLLQIIDNPQQDIALAAVLRSPFVGCTVEELATIRRLGGKDCNFWQAVQKAAQAQVPELAQKLQSFLQKLERWRTMARREKLASFIATIYRESGYADFVAGMKDGVRRLANIRALFLRARQFDRFSRQGLRRFLQFIEQLQKQGEDLGAARVLGENEDVVRIMSIHKAKGLEFPVVFLCNTGKEFNLQDQREAFLLHRRLGLAPIIVDVEEKVRYPSLPYLALRLLGEAETKAEELRLLYVALTRAREKLYIIGSLTGVEAKIGNSKDSAGLNGEKLPAYLLRNAKSFLDWLLLALSRHPELVPQKTNFKTAAEARFSLTLIPQIDEVAVTTSAKQAEEEIKSALLALKPLPLDTDETIEKMVAERLNFMYPYRKAKLPAKLSVTELKRRFARQELSEGEAQALVASQWKRPEFLQKRKGPTAVERGQLYHTVLQHLDLQQPVDTEGVLRQMESMVQRGIIAAESLPYLKPEHVAAFFTTEAGKQVLKYKDQVLREWPFTLALPVSELAKGKLEAADPGEDTVIIQGIIDLLIPTPSGYILIDYKTDRDVDSLLQRYRLQLFYYVRAVEQILKQPVAAVYLYAISAKQVLKVEELE
ncbi:MAG: helicase-exonuclease AddAB subunit AddA [Firmicutes bacterium]|nr:helicase-exonuclease AddAB subunit AddA [Bacillota bacterium]